MDSIDIMLYVMVGVVFTASVGLFFGLIALQNDVSYSYTAPTINGDVCHREFINDCGDFLTSCDSGREYHCVHDVVKLK